MQGGTAFLTWVNKVCNTNDELTAQESVYYIPPGNLQCHLIPCLNLTLKRMYNGNNAIPAGARVGLLDSIIDLEEWMEWVHHLEEDLNLQCNQWVVETVRKARPMAATVNSNAGTTNSITMVTSNSGNTLLPRLTDNEKNLLTVHRGCYKCCVFYAGHLSQECPISRATIEACKAVTLEH